ncbi:MAG: PAS domain S-box protein, partial [Candidatus Omnitrophica bacterium]|nr:PAS domain S-box protein [Candidatus Omnitrophota bacterium]
MEIDAVIGTNIFEGWYFAFIPESKINLWIIFSVIIFGVIVGTIIGNFAKIKGSFGRDSDREIKVAEPNEALTLAIRQQISKLSASSENQKQVAEAMSSLFTEELYKKMELVNQQLDKTYKKAIDQAQKSAEIVKNKYEELSVEKKRTEAIIRSIAEGLVVVNEKGEVLLMNPAAERLLGVKKEEKLGESILKDLKDEHLISLVKGSFDKEDKAGAEIELNSSEDATKKVLRASSAVIENEYGKTVGMVSVLTDVTKQKELDRMKSDFVSKVSHELRTPIVTVQNSISLLLSKTTGSL